MINHKLIKRTIRFVLNFSDCALNVAFQVTMKASWKHCQEWQIHLPSMTTSLQSLWLLFFLLFKIEWKCSGRKLYTRGNWESANPNKGGNWRKEGRRAPFTGSSSISHSFVPSPLSESLEQALDRRHIDLKEEPKAVYVQRVSSGKRFLLCGRPAKLTGMTLEGGSCCTERVLI